jgi:hypothetical protein
MKSVTYILYIILYTMKTLYIFQGRLYYIL